MKVWAVSCLALLMTFLALRVGATELTGDENTVWVVGHRRAESKAVRVTGQSSRIVPEDETRFDTATQLRRDSSVLLPETGRISPSGFVVPRIRGQDVKLTDVYVEDILVQDPYTGLPLLENIDLRAFGSLEVYPGLSPVEMSGFNSVGTIRYGFRPFSKPSYRLGVQTGRPFGQSLWAASRQTSDDQTWKGQIYGRGHRTDGRYPYYSDEGTPYNQSDDEIRIRDNNDQRSVQAIPNLQYQGEDFSVSAVAIAYRGDRGLPSLTSKIGSSTRLNTTGYLAGASLRKNLGNVAAAGSTSLLFQAASADDQRDLNDPGNRFTGVSDTSRMQILTQRFGGGLLHQNQILRAQVSGEIAEARIQNNLGERVAIGIKRQTVGSTMAAAVRPQRSIVVETKVHTKSLHDRRIKGSEHFLPGESSPPSPRHFGKAAGGAVALLPSSESSVYVQYAISERPPSLLEEFGDGGGYRPSGDLEAERLRHNEIGAQWRSPAEDWHLSWCTFQDHTDQKIVVVPTYVNAVKAINLREAEIVGVDFKGDVKVEHSTFYLSYSRLFPYDVTGGEKRILPGVPEFIVVGELDQRWGAFTGRWLYRQRSSVFVDLENKVVLPDIGTHDISLDFSSDDLQREQKFLFGIAVRNVLDVKDVAISAPGSQSSQGRTALSDVSGEPLPGRQWLLSASSTF